MQALDRAGELLRIPGPISPVLQITARTDQESKSPAPSLPSQRTRETDPRFAHLGGKALLFENVEGSDFPVLINQFGSYRRVEMALGCEDGGLEALADRIGKLVKPEPPPTLLAKLQKIPELLELTKIPPKRVRSGVCQEVVKTGDQIDLRRLPILRCWPLDGDFATLGYPANTNAQVEAIERGGPGSEWERLYRGRYITLAGIHTIHHSDVGNPFPTSRNIGMYRVQLFGKKHMSMHWHMHHDGARHWRSWKEAGQPMPVAIALGGESVMPYAATAPMPPGISEMLLAGFLNRGSIPLVPCKTVPLDVPANSEIVIEGYVRTDAGFIGYDPREPSHGPLGPGAVFEGPFGDHTGFYSLPDRYPLLEVTAITHRKNAIYPTTVVGLPPQEDYFLGKATERVFLPLLKTLIPDIIDYDLPMFGVFHSCAFVKIKKEYPLQARRVMSSIWGAGQMAWTKTIVVVDHDVNVHDTPEVIAAIGKFCDPSRDVVAIDGPLDILDHAASYLGAGSKLGFDATRKRPGEEVHGPAITADPNTPLLAPDQIPGALSGFVNQVRQLSGVLDVHVPTELGGRWAMVQVDREIVGSSVMPIGNAQPAAIASAIAAIDIHPAPAFVVLLGRDVRLRDLDDALFHWCAHLDAKRDTSPQLPLRGGDTVHRLVFDSTPKSPADARYGLPARTWPPVIRMHT